MKLKSSPNLMYAKGTKKSDSYTFKSLYSYIQSNVQASPAEQKPDDAKLVQFIVYIRTNSSDNLVVLPSAQKFYGQFSCESNLPFSKCPYPTLIYDYGLAIAKKYTDSLLDLKEETDLKKFAANSDCFPVGAIETADTFYEVFNIVVSSNILPGLKFKSSDAKWGKIEDLTYLEKLPILDAEVYKSLVLVH